MQTKKKVACAALATTLVACIDLNEPDTPELPDSGSNQPGYDAGPGKPGDDDDAEVDGGDEEDAGDDAGPIAILSRPSRGSAIALSDDEQRAVVVNRDVGSASVIDVKYEKDKTTRIEQRYELPLGQGSEPWQAAIGPDSDTAYVVLRRDQKLVRITT